MKNWFQDKNKGFWVNNDSSIIFNLLKYHYKSRQKIVNSKPESMDPIYNKIRLQVIFTNPDTVRGGVGEQRGQQPALRCLSLCTLGSIGTQSSVLRSEDSIFTRVSLKRAEKTRKETNPQLVSARHVRRSEDWSSPGL